MLLAGNKKLERLLNWTAVMLLPQASLRGGWLIFMKEWSASLMKKVLLGFFFTVDH
jgi:hypothetical protein